MTYPGKLALIGSGETTPLGGQIFEGLAQSLRTGLRIGVLETPAGFELNSAQVAGRVVKYLEKRLQNYQPVIELIPARKKGTHSSPDDPAVAAQVLKQDILFLGPGSPT